MKGEIEGSDPLEGIWTAFSAISRDAAAERGCADGQHEECITLDGLRRACKEFKLRVSEEELKFMMEEADSDKGGSVDYEEFLQIMSQAPWF